MVVHIACAYDDNYFKPFCALISSLMHNHARGGLSLHVIASDTGESKVNDIKSFVGSYSNAIQFYNICDPKVSTFVRMSTWSEAVYYRLYFPLLLPDTIDRIIYLDSDTIALRSLESLYKENLEGYCVGAVYDNYIKSQPLIGIDQHGEYFNSGMLLIDLKLWRETKVSECSFDYLTKYPERIRYVDQCALNAVLHHKWKKLPEKYNFLYSYFPEVVTSEALQKIKNETDLIHFTLQRPWNMLCKNRFRRQYKFYLSHFPHKIGKPINDFSPGKLPKLLWYRILEKYNDSAFSRKAWMNFKSLYRNRRN
jgi:lipopolysaccharide biosynthesis glycosyltransferase